MKNKGTVFVGLSGGVDSSVAALRLKQQGYNVVGVFIKVWHPKFMVCNWEQERLDSMRVAAHLEIPFLTCDAEATYRNEVAEYFISEYKSGRTPNPDVMCNKTVKFGAFVEFAKLKGADYIATGHYAQKINDELYRGVDTIKDQTYFLWMLSQEQLDYALFPVGDTSKERIRKEAEAAGIPVAEKQDSQGICFLGQVNIPEFLSHYVDLKAGDVLDTENNVIGQHAGALVYTLGQRHGFTLNNATDNREPYYVVSKILKKNQIIVGNKKSIINEAESVLLRDVILRTEVSNGSKLEAQFRYRQEPFAVKLKKIKNGIEIIPMTDVHTPAPGQSCVLYKDSVCIGGGIIA